MSNKYIIYIVLFALTITSALADDHVTQYEKVEWTLELSALNDTLTNIIINDTLPYGWKYIKTESITVSCSNSTSILVENIGFTVNETTGFCPNRYNASTKQIVWNITGLNKNCNLTLNYTTQPTGCSLPDNETHKNCNLLSIDANSPGGAMHLNTSTCVNYTPVKVEFNKTVVMIDDNTARVEIKIKTSDGDYFANRIPTDIVIVTDVSGSMGNNNKIGGAKNAAKNFTYLILNHNPINGVNKVGLVSYSSQTVNTQAMTTSETILYNTIDSYSADGSTCVCCGVNSAINLLNQSNSSNKVIVIMSDGEANMGCGGGAKQDAVDAAKKAKDNNITLYTIAFGDSGVDASTLESMAEKGGGKFYISTSLIRVYRDIAYAVLNISAVAENYTLNDIIPNGLAANGININPYWISDSVTQSNESNLTWRFKDLYYDETVTINFNINISPCVKINISSNDFIMVNQSVNFSARVENCGNVDMENLTVFFKSNNTFLAHKIIPYLKAGNSSKININFTFNESGGYNISAGILTPVKGILNKHISANYNPGMLETPVSQTKSSISANLFNGNWGHSEKQVMVKTKPDIVLSNISFNPSSPTEGQIVEISVSVFNLGDTNTNNFRVHLLVDNLSAENKTISVNGNSMIPVEFNWTASSGTHSIKISADASNDVEESDENNNEIEKQITVASSTTDSTRTQSKETETKIKENETKGIKITYKYGTLTTFINVSDKQVSNIPSEISSASTDTGLVLYNNEDGAVLKNFTFFIGTRKIKTDEKGVIVGEDEVDILWNSLRASSAEPTNEVLKIISESGNTSAKISGVFKGVPSGLVFKNGMITDAEGNPVQGNFEIKFINENGDVITINLKEGKVDEKDSKTIEKILKESREHAIEETESEIKQIEPKITIPENLTHGKVFETEVKDSEGNPIRDKEVEITLPNGDKIKVKTNKDGKVKLVMDDGKIVPVEKAKIDLPEILEEGKVYEVEVRDENGNLVKDGVAEITLPNGDKIKVKTNKDGKIKLMYNDGKITQIQAGVEDIFNDAYLYWYYVLPLLLIPLILFFILKENKAIADLEFLKEAWEQGKLNSLSKFKIYVTPETYAEVTGWRVDVSNIEKQYLNEKGRKYLDEFGDETLALAKQINAKKILTESVVREALCREKGFKTLRFDDIRKF